MFRLLSSLLMLAGLAYGGYWAWNTYPPLRQFVMSHIDGDNFLTLEIRHTAEQIMEQHKKELLKNNRYTYLEPKTSYHPYLLMEVKYTRDDNTTAEGVLLWGLLDAEMVLNAQQWERTHGFEDCLVAHANKNDFKILKTLVECGGSIDREKLYDKFRLDSDILDDWVESCRAKKLIVSSGNKLRLHFQNPKLEINPETRLDEWLVSQPTTRAERLKRRYTPTQIEKLSAEIFGGDFAIRKMSEVYLPVYTLCVQNPDGSLLTTTWNALTGKRLADLTF